MPITEWPVEDRPREKLLKQGENALTDAELIAIFLNTGTRHQTALDIAKDLLRECGSLKKLLQPPSQRLLNKPGIGPAKYAALKAAIELGRRYLEGKIAVGDRLDSTLATQRFLSSRLRHATNEQFACLLLDNHFRLLHFEVVFQGTVNETAIYPREIVRRCLECNAVNVILAHNHPSGIATPSTADKSVTQLMQKALALIDVQLVDHIIVGDPEIFSFAEKGLIA